MRHLFFWMVLSMLSLWLTLGMSAEAPINDGFDKGLATARNWQQKLHETFQSYKPTDAINNYKTPDATQYADNPDVIKTDTDKRMKDNITYQSIVQSKETRPKYDIKPDAPFIQHINEKANDVYDVITGQFGDCTKSSQCNISYEDVLCETTPQSVTRFCQKTLEIEWILNQIQNRYILTVHLTSAHHNYAGNVINAYTGGVKTVLPGDASTSLQGRLPSDTQCQGLQGRVISQTGTKAKLDYISYPSCARPFIDFHVSNSKGPVNVTLTVELTETKIVEVPQDKWIDGCADFAANDLCKKQSEYCVAENATYEIHGQSITRECWKYESKYQCGKNIATDHCQAYIDQGCLQTNSTCTELSENGCVRYQQTYRCQKKDCKNVGMICNATTYCLDGNCINKTTQPDPDFKRAVSALSAADQAAKAFSQFDSIFAGKSKQCDKFILNFLDCCADKGWGKDHIANCSQEEKNLKEDREQLLTRYVGEYCKKNAVGACIEYRKVFCVFPSRLARIIQEQGRDKQLGIDFGSAKEVNCRGLTRDEFSQLDLSKIDFSDFYQDIESKMRPIDANETTNKIKERIKNKKDEENNKHGS